MAMNDPEALAYYLSRSVFWDGGSCSNLVAEEAECGNKSHLMKCQKNGFRYTVNSTPMPDTEEEK